jgi:Cu+-exporting ATPase
MRVLSNKGIFVKNVNAIEKLDKINAIVFDKTGTITQSGDGLVNFNGKTLTDAEKSYIKSIPKGSIHPLSKSIYGHLEETVIEVFDFKEVEGKGIEGVVNNHKIKLGSAQYVDVSTELSDIKLASTVHVAIDEKYLGYFEIKKKYRKGLKNLIDKLQPNYSLHLLTGDGNQEQTYLKKLFTSDSKLHFKQTPDDKLNYLEALKSNGDSPIMIGDGLNDAGALKAATVGISISDDVYSFSPSCDIIMEADKFDQVGSIIEFAKKSVSIVKVSLVISILYNIVGLSFAVTGQLSPLYTALLMPLSSLTVVGFVTLATNLAGRKVF